MLKKRIPQKRMFLQRCANTCFGKSADKLRELLEKTHFLCVVHLTKGINAFHCPYQWLVEINNLKKMNDLQEHQNKLMRKGKARGTSRI